MKTLLLAAAAAVSLTAPAFADADFARAHFAQSEEGSDRIAVLSAPSAGDASAVIAHFAQDRETGDGPKVLVPEVTGVVISTSNSDLAAYAAAKLETDTSFLD